MMTREIDLHGMNCSQAKKCLDSYISALPKGECELSVIHGFNRGNALKKMVAGYSHKRVKGKFAEFNQGITTLIIK